MGVTIFGIRHHGPGCARSLQNALGVLRPDLVLVEGPPDADDEIAAVAAAGMTPPVALLVHRVDRPECASFWPFAEFSPEWQALRWAVENGVPARFCDLPAAVHLADAGADEADGSENADEAVGAELEPRRDPLEWLARADGYSDSERWWNDRIEESDDVQLFAAIATAVGAVRQELALPETKRTLQREAWMRRTLQKAQKEGFGNIAFVCGAWHAPAMATGSKADDDALLKDLPKCKVRTTWTPWTYARLTRASGYGAGITSPGWYEHLWQSGPDLLPRWLVRAARVLRAQDLEASSASVVEATRLCEALAGLRGRPRPGLPETLQAIEAVFARGEPSWRPLLQKDLLVGDRLGELPAGLARLPLEEDVLATMRSLRLKQAASATRVELDLREESGKARSVFLHRLAVLRLPYGEKANAGRTRGTFKEVWQLQWRPEFALAVVDAAAYGNTVEAAAAQRVAARAASGALPELVELLEVALFADVPTAVAAVLAALAARAAGTGDVDALLAAIPPLCQVTRYGDVRQSDGTAVRAIVHGLAERVHVALPNAGHGVDDERARQLATHLRAHRQALELLADDALLAGFDDALQRLLATAAHALLRGLALRQRRDAGRVDDATVALALARELSPGAAPVVAAAWIDGFLTDAGAILAHERSLLQLLDGWVASLPDDVFQQVLPLVRRTFATFAAGERRQIAGAVRTLRPGEARPAAPLASMLAFEPERAAPAIAATAALLGLPETTR
jgi:hypothetical protein